MTLVIVTSIAISQRNNAPEKGNVKLNCVKISRRRYYTRKLY